MTESKSTDHIQRFHIGIMAVLAALLIAYAVHSLLEVAQELLGAGIIDLINWKLRTSYSYIAPLRRVWFTPDLEATRLIVAVIFLVLGLSFGAQVSRRQPQIKK